MSNSPSPAPRSVALANTIAAAAVTLAIGATAGSLLGWFRPTPDASQIAEAAGPADAAGSAQAAPTPDVILVPVTAGAAPVEPPITAIRWRGEREEAEDDDDDDERTAPDDDGRDDGRDEREHRRRNDDHHRRGERGRHD